MAEGERGPTSGGTARGFTPRLLDTTTVAVPLLQLVADADDDELVPIVVELNLEHVDGQARAHERLVALVEEVAGPTGVVREDLASSSQRYVVADLPAAAVAELVRLDGARAEAATGPPDASPTRRRLVHKVWPDFEVGPHVTSSVATVKADAAVIAFSALGEGVVWAVADSGIDATSRHFERHATLQPEGLEHRSFVGGDPLEDAFGHGTHVGGIIAGEYVAGAAAGAPGEGGEALPPAGVVRPYRDPEGRVRYWREGVERVAGVAPRARLVSLKVLDDAGRGRASHVIAALEHVQQVNAHGQHLRIHGVNLSVGYPFDPEWFACGQSPLCVEVDRLVRSGVVVVVAAGNTGYGSMSTLARGTVQAGMDMSINDPGNADLAITVGATHRDSPHQYGVSYFSSKGPTGDGRPKPDLVAPGERIVSAASTGKAADAAGVLGTPATEVDYVEDSGTSMAAPHVSGAVAAFLSVRREFVGHPQRLKRLLCESATDLHRAPHFQGHGLLDLMRAIQSV